MSSVSMLSINMQRYKTANHIYTKHCIVLPVDFESAALFWWSVQRCAALHWSSLSLAALAQQPAAASTAEGLWFAAVAGSARWVSAAPAAGSGSEWQNLHYSCPYHHHLTTAPQQNHFIYFRQQAYILNFFKHASPSPFYFPQNAMDFTILSFFFVQLTFTFYIKDAPCGYLPTRSHLCFRSGNG